MASWSWVDYSRGLYPGMSVAELPLIAMMTLYCDESDDGLTYALAGWLAEPDSWDRFVPLWRDMLTRHPLPDGRPMKSFHAVDIVERDRISDSPFRGWLFEQETAVFKDACDILLSDDCFSKIHRIGVSVTYPREVPGIPAHERDQGAWLNLAQRLLWMLLKHGFMSGGLSVVFDDKASVRDIVNKTFYSARDAVRAESSEYIDPAVTFRSDDVVSPLQAADLLAYEWRKRTSDQLVRVHKKPRKSYLRLKERPGVMECYGPMQMLNILDSLMKGQSMMAAMDRTAPVED